MNHQAAFRRASFFLLMLTFFLPIMSIFVEADDDLPAVTISLAVSDTRDTLIVTGKVTGTVKTEDQQFYLFRCLPGEFDNPQSTPIDKTPSDDDFTFTVPLDLDDPSLALYGYGIGISDKKTGYHIISNRAYLPTPSLFSKISPDKEPTLLSKKGLEVQLYADAVSLGVSYTVIPCYLDTLIPGEQTIKDLQINHGGEGLTSFIFGGRRYYINTSTLNMIDYRIKTATASGIRVYLNILLAYGEQAPADLYTDWGKSIDAISVPNAKTSTGAKRLGAIVHYLAERYGEKDGLYGECRRFILGYENDNTGVNQGTEEFDTEAYIRNCAYALRIADTAARSGNCNARCYLSLSHHWADTSEGIGGRDLLAHLINDCHDIPFGIALNPIPSSRQITDERLDPHINDTNDTPYLTMANIDVISDLLQSEPYRNEDDTAKTIVVASYGIPSDGTPQSERNQAAAYLRGYIKANRNPLIEAFIWHRHVDFSEEQGGGYGLYTTGKSILQPAEKKLLYDVFAKADSEHIGEILDEYRAEIGNNFESEYLSDLPEGFHKTTLEKTVEKPGKTESIFDFNQSLYTFSPTYNSEYIEQRIDKEDSFEFRCLHSSLTAFAPDEWMGISCPIADCPSLSDHSCIGIKLRVSGNTETAPVQLKLTFFGNVNGKRTEWTAQTVIKNNRWENVWFSLEKFSENAPTAGTFAILVLPDNPSGTTAYSLDIAEISVGSASGKLLASGTIRRILPVGIIILVAAALTVLLVLLISGKRNKEKETTPISEKSGTAHWTWLHTGALLRRSKELKNNRHDIIKVPLNANDNSGTSNIINPPRAVSHRHTKKGNQNRHHATEKTGISTSLKRRIKHAVHNYRMASMQQQKDSSVHHTEIRHRDTKPDAMNLTVRPVVQSSNHTATKTIHPINPRENSDRTSTVKLPDEPHFRAESQNSGTEAVLSQQPPTASQKTDNQPIKKREAKRTI